MNGPATNDLINNLVTQASANINYFKLVRVEIFDSYETTQSGEILINKPRFRPLKKEDLDSLEEIKLMRLKRFYSNVLNLRRDALSLPIQNQYFFVTPYTVPRSVSDGSSSGAVMSSREGITALAEYEIANIAIQHRAGLQLDYVGVTSNTINQSETSTSISTIETPFVENQQPSFDITVPGGY